MILLNPANPINKKHSLNKNLVAWWLAHPQFSRGNKIRDLMWRLDADIVSYNVGTYWSGNQKSPGVYGAWNFNGISGYAKLNNYISANLLRPKQGFNEGFSIFAVIKPYSLQVQRTIFGHCSGGTIFGWSFGIDDTTLNKIKFSHGNGASTATTISNTALVKNTWSTVGLTFYFTQNASGYLKKIYINGVKDTVQYTPVSLQYSGSVSSIGRWEGGAAQYFNGGISSLMFYNSLLDDNRIRLLHNQARNGYIGQLNFIKPATGITGYVVGNTNILQAYRRIDFGGDFRGVYRGAARGVV